MAYYDWDQRTEFKGLVGLTLTDISQTEDEMTFTADAGERFKLYHAQDCCEYVSIEDVCGDLSDVIGSPILMAEESSNSDDPPKDGYDESHTWTFYKLATIKGSVTIRWYGSSNGYYSEGVDFVRLNADQD